MTKRVVPSVLVMCTVIVLAAVDTSLADNADVLPKGVFRALVDTHFFRPIEKRFNDNGNPEDVAEDFNNRRLDSGVFSGLSLIESAFGMTPGSASLGDARVSFQYEFTILHAQLQYGVTDRLTAGVHIPYLWRRNNVQARLDSGPGSSATVGKNAAIASLAPLTFPGTVPLTTEDVQNLLGPGLDVNGDGTLDIAGFGFKRVDNWSDEGLGDIEAGFKYQPLRTPDLRLATTFGARFPTGKVDDPDSLVDFEFGSGAYAVLLRLHADYVVSNLWSPTRRTLPARASVVLAPGDLVINGTFRYDLVLPDRERKRVPGDVDNPVTTNQETVNRDLGDIFASEVSLRYGLLQGLTASVLYRYEYKLEDEISGRKAFRYRSLEEETETEDHVYVLALAYSTVPLYREGKFPIPLGVSLAYRKKFAGRNVLKSEYIGVGIEILF